MNVISSVVSFLKKAEKDAADAIGVAAKAAPAVAAVAEAGAVATGNAGIVPFIEKMSALTTGAGALVQTVQGAKGTGADKLAVAAPQLDSLLRDSGFLSDKIITDLDKWEKAVESIAGSFADLFASVSAKAVSTAPAAPVAVRAAS